MRVARFALPWGLLYGIGMLFRTLFDTFAPPAPTGYGARSAATTWFAVATFFLAGLVSSYRTRQAASGPLVAVTASVIGNVLAVTGTLVLFLTVIRRDPHMLRTFEMTGGWDEGLLLPIVMIPIVAAIGLVGGLIAAASSGTLLRIQRRT
jgi:hypothetical protein